MTAIAPGSLPLEATLQQAVTHHQAGRLQEAEYLYRAILQVRPAQPDANHNLGLLAGQVGRHAAGLPHLKAALDADPSQGQYWLSYAEALLASGRAGEALQVIQTALQGGFDHPAAHTLRQKAESAAREGAPAQAEIDQMILLFNADRHAELEGRARALLERHPDSGFGWKALGVALRSQGKDALAALQKTVERLPDDAEAHNNLGNALRELGRLDDSAASCRRALRIKPDYAEAHSDLGVALSDLGQLVDAVASYRRALQLKPELAVTHNNLGAALQDLRQLDDAVACYRRALQLKPDYAEAHNNLGTALDDLGRTDDAMASYQRALQIKPDFTEALNRLALLLNAQDRALQALNLVSRSLQLKETEEIRHIFVACVKRLRSDDHPAWVRHTLLRALAEPWCWPGELAPAGANLVKLERGIRECVARAVAVWPQRLPAPDLFGPAGIVTVADPLFYALLDATPNCDIDLERLLTLARHTLLDAATAPTACTFDDEIAFGFYSVLARQCFINEYVFAWSDEEAGRARNLRDLLASTLEFDAQIPALWPIAVAAYFPLHSLPFAGRLLDRTWPDAVLPVLAQQVQEPVQERQLRTAIPRLNIIEDATSLPAQSQNEENPYPRWIKAAPAGETTSLDGYIRKHFPLAPFQPLGASDGPDILIAGCGTGLHPISSVRCFKEARVLAVDLSATSLCYAKRKTQALGLTSIEYAQGDVLKIGALGRSFDLIESNGVPHHPADPWAGWRALLPLLRPGGLMRLGLYSATARRDIVRARHFIAARGYGATAEDVRKCRQEMIDSDQADAWGNTLKSADFFSVGACRDLLFHRQEQCMSLPDIGAFLRDNGLRLLGFQLDAHVLHAYRQRFADDPAATRLDYWQQFETDHPDTFCTMYQFWVQKIMP